MGPYRTQALIAVLWTAILLTPPLIAQEPGWHYSPLPGEGDRATAGCDRDATPDVFSCLVVRCESDFSTGIYVDSNRPDDLGRWSLTVDREDFSAEAVAGEGPYGGKFVADADWLLERLQQGSFVYLRHSGDDGLPYRHIGLSGSLYAINRALAWCAPRAPADERISLPDVG